MLDQVLSKKKMALMELNHYWFNVFCSRAIISARAFIRRFYDLIASVKNGKPYYTVRLNSEVKADARVWLNFLDQFNGQCYFPDRFWSTNESLELFTDSAGNVLLGCGAYFQGHWVQYQWPSSWADTSILLDITCLELIPIVLSFMIWGRSFRNKKILLRIDNQALVSIENKRTSKSKRVMILIRQLVFLTMNNNIQFRAQHIEGEHNANRRCSFSISGTTFYGLGPECRQFSSSNPTRIPVDDFRTEMNHLLINSLAPSTQKAYLHSMDIFVKFRENHGFSDVWPIPLDDLTSFIVYMFRKKLSHSTVSGYISGLSYFNKINNLEDNTQKFVVRKLIEGIKKDMLQFGSLILSITLHAFGEARGRPGGVNLGLQRMGVNIWWQGKCGGKVLDMKQQIRTMLKYEDPPTILVLHIGGNDIGEKSSKTLCELIRKQFSWMRQLMLDTVFVWSQIIPRSSWRYSDNIDAMENVE
ncbi:unnamed protein product [Mytilus edulis]|uniref:Uncharacterized protein n=1 Tax=Mytilus edulis TaxID=6550 RepID=A0A8S3R4X0_MYTED|nr:unnamed protein product [Mytilus edulis]